MGVRPYVHSFTILPFKLRHELLKKFCLHFPFFNFPLATWAFEKVDASFRTFTFKRTLQFVKHIHFFRDRIHQGAVGIGRILHSEAMLQLLRI